MSVLVDRVLKLLSENNKSQVELANYLGVSATVISAWKKGKSFSYYSFLENFAEFFEIDVNELYELAEEERSVPKQYTVYKHTSPNGKIYIGITEAAVEKRWKYGRGYEYNTHFYNAIKKYGWDNFEHEVLFTNLTAEEAAQKEIELIALYHSDDRSKGYNVSPGGTLVASSSKDKIRQSRINSDLNNKQSKRSKEYWGDPNWREKTIRNMRGKKRTDEQKNHYKIARAKQSPMTDNTKQKIRETLSKKTGEKSLRKKAVLQIEPVTMKVINRFCRAAEEIRLAHDCRTLYRRGTWRRRKLYQKISAQRERGKQDGISETIIRKSDTEAIQGKRAG